MNQNFWDIWVVAANAQNMVLSWINPKQVDTVWASCAQWFLCRSPFNFYSVKSPPMDLNSLKYWVSSSKGSQVFLRKTQEGFKVFLRSVWILILAHRRRKTPVQCLTTAVIYCCPASQQKPLQSENWLHYHIFHFTLPWHGRDSHSSCGRGECTDWHWCPHVCKVKTAALSPVALSLLVPH